MLIEILSLMAVPSMRVEGLVHERVAEPAPAAAGVMVRSVTALGRLGATGLLSIYRPITSELSLKLPILW
ncbi:MAG: hypothetical protein IJE18_09350 [Bacteroidaceae bacterium]|nr:hypothetical protein [Bacteroidaceae bacterium]